MKRSVRIIIVEDNENLSKGWMELFDLLGHDAWNYSDANSFLSDTDAPNHCELLITDYYLPDHNGVELIKKFRKKSPETPAIVITGSKEEFIAEATNEIDNCHLIYKPLNIEQIEDKISEIFGAE